MTLPIDVFRLACRSGDMDSLVQCVSRSMRLRDASTARTSVARSPLQQQQAEPYNVPNLAHGRSSLLEEAGVEQLILAVKEGREAVCSFLLGFDQVDVNGRDTDGRTALMHVAADGSLAMATMLLEHNADVNARIETDTSSTSVLALAVGGSAAEAIVPCLLEAKADANAPIRHAKSGYDTTVHHTCLSLAAQRASHTVAFALLDSGADVNVVLQGTEVKGDTFLLHLLGTSATNASLERALAYSDVNVNAANEAGTNALMKAARDCRWSAMMSLLEAHADVNARDTKCKTALHFAAEKGDTDMMFSLMEWNADVTACDAYDFCAAQYAAEKGCTDAAVGMIECGAYAHADPDDPLSLVFNALLDRGARADTAICMMDAWAKVALRHCENDASYCASPEHVEAEMFRLLSMALELNQGHLVVQASERWGLSLGLLRCTWSEDDAHDGIARLQRLFLDIAAPNSEGAASNSIVLLLELGCDVHARNSAGETTLMIAARETQANVDAVDRLIEWKADVHATITASDCGEKEIDPDCVGRTALMGAASFGNAHLSTKLIQTYGARVDAATEAGTTSLMMAAKAGHTNTALALINCKANVNHCDARGETSLALAAEAGHSYAVARLVERKASIYTSNTLGVTALMHAATQGREGSVHALLVSHTSSDRGARTPRLCFPQVLSRPSDAYVNAVDFCGTTALMRAAANGHAHTVVMLVRAGAAVDVRNNNGDTALRFALAGGHSFTAARLLELNACVDVDLIVSAQKACAEVAAWRESLGVPTESCSGDTISTRSGEARESDDQAQSLQAVLDEMLFSAAEQGKSDLVLRLLDAQADVNAVCAPEDRTGRTSVMCAQYMEDIHAHTLAVLCEQKADVNAVSQRGKTALSIACKYSKVNCVHTLLQCNAIVPGAPRPQTQGLTATLPTVEDKERTNGAQLMCQRHTHALKGCFNRLNVDVCAQLLEASADVHLYDYDSAALFIPVAFGSTDMVDLLIAAKADVNERSDEYPMIGCALNALVGSHMVVRLFELQVTNVPSLVSALQPTCKPAAFARLLEHVIGEVTTADEVARKQALLNSFLLQCPPKCAGLVNLLLRKGAAANTVDTAGILEYPGRFRDKNTRGFTLLHMAAADPKGVDTLVQLIAAKADVNLASAEGHCPLFLAVSEGSLRAATLLLEAGAVVEGKGATVHLDDLPTSNWSRCTLRMLRLLLEHKVSWKPSNAAWTRGVITWIELRGGRSDVVRLLVEQAGVDVNMLVPVPRSETMTPGGSDDTLLLAAVHRGLMRMVRTLLDLKANVELASDHGRTPLMVATRVRNIRTLRYLCERGANVNFAGVMADGKQETALGTAVECGYSDAVAALIELKADIDAPAYSALLTTTCPAVLLAPSSLSVTLQLIDANCELSSPATVLVAAVGESGRSVLKSQVGWNALLVYAYCAHQESLAAQMDNWTLSGGEGKRADATAQVWTAQLWEEAQWLCVQWYSSWCERRVQVETALEGHMIRDLARIVRAYAVPFIEDLKTFTQLSAVRDP